MAVELYSFDRD